MLRLTTYSRLILFTSLETWTTLILLVYLRWQCHSRIFRLVLRWYISWSLYYIRTIFFVKLVSSIKRFFYLIATFSILSLYLGIMKLGWLCYKIFDSRSWLNDMKCRSHFWIYIILSRIIIIPIYSKKSTVLIIWQ